MLYMFHYNCNNTTFGYDFERLASELGAKKAYGSYRGTGQVVDFYLVPTKSIYTELKKVAKEKYHVDMQKLQRYREEDYPNIKLITEGTMSVVYDNYATKLKEWVDANGNKIASNQPSTSTNSSSHKGDFTEKFKKLCSHIDSVWGGLNIIRCTAHTLAIYYGYGQKWYHLIIRYIPEEGCFEINLSERRPGDKLIYAGEADSWAELLDILMQTETIKDRKLCEWVDSNGNKINKNTSVSKSITNNNTTEEVVYIWDMYIDTRDKGTWCSAEEYNGEYDGSVFKTKEAAYNEGKIHLYELEDEGQLRGDPGDYDIDVIAIPKNKVSGYTLEFSGLL